jgi:hypothetical protein
MLGSVLICGSNKKARLEKAWELLLPYGFRSDASSPDLLIVRKESEKKSIGISQAREIKSFMRERPFESSIKAVLVEEAQLFTDDAQGSLLKVLEEPPTFGLIILLCDKQGSLLATVTSRCQVLLIKGLDLKDKSKSFIVSNLGYEEIFGLAKELSASGRDDAILFMENVLREDITNGVSLGVIEKTEKVLKELKDANVSLKFALEYLLLLHKLSPPSSV